MSVEIYFEGGPLDGQSTATQECKPTHVIQMSNGDDAAMFRPMGSKESFAIPTMKVETREYLREYAPHREGVVTYFWTEEDRQAAYREDTWEDPRDVREAQLAGYLHATVRVQQGDPRGPSLG